jgi:hypothetical protein
MELQAKLRKTWDEMQKKTPDQPTDVLVIHAENVSIGYDPGILQFNPMKVILVGSKISGTPVGNQLGDEEGSAPRRPILKAEMQHSGKWQIRENQQLQDALEDEPSARSWFSCKPWHVVYTVDAQPALAPAPAKRAPTKKGVHTLHGYY